jgi:hypothetical protein
MVFTSCGKSISGNSLEETARNSGKAITGYTIAAPSMTLSKLLVKSTVVAALGGLRFGFDTAVIAGITHAITMAYALSPSGLGLTVASALRGTIVGAMLAGIPGERLA